MDNALPKYATLQKWTELTGVSRSRTYLALSRRELRAVKLGRRVLIDVETGMRWLASQPAAEIRIAAGRTAA